MTKFLTLPTKVVLEVVEMLAPGFYNPSELEAIRLADDFGGWCELGYYRKGIRKYVDDLSTYDTYNTPNRTDEEHIETWEERFCKWIRV